MRSSKARRRPRGHLRGDRRSTGDDGRPIRLEHWRADGQPKVRYATEADANRVSLQVRIEHGNDQVAYICQMCGGWHLANR